MKNEPKFARQLHELLKNVDKLEEANDYVDHIVESVRNGHDESKIRKLHGKGPLLLEGAIEVAKSRISVSGKFTRWNRLWLDRYSASYSTPERVARYRAKRLSSMKLVDVGCGAGMQTAFFSGTSSVTGIELSPMRAVMAELNAMVYGHTPRKIINADYVNVIEKLDVDSETVIFSDPLRPRTESERRLESLVPSPAILRSFLVKKTEKFVFDLPPQISWDNIGLEGEKEYISIDGLLNRLTLYQGDLKQSETSAVILPDNIRIEGKPGQAQFDQAESEESHIFVPDISLVYSRLVDSVNSMGKFRLLSRDKRRTVLTGNEEANGYFPGEVFTVLDTASPEELSGKLKKLDCGKTVLRYSLDPDDYYRERNEIEGSLSGEEEFHLFKNNKKYIICRKDDGNADKPVNNGLMQKIE